MGRGAPAMSGEHAVNDVEESWAGTNVRVWSRDKERISESRMCFQGVASVG